jgi:integrase
VNVSIRAVLAEYLDAYSDITVDSHYFIFFNTLTGDYIQPIKRGQAWKFITTICQSVGIRGNFGTHSLHKTWGCQARMNRVDRLLPCTSSTTPVWPTPNAIWA